MFAPDHNRITKLLPAEVCPGGGGAPQGTQPWGMQIAQSLAELF